MRSVVSVIVHPSRIFREGLSRILAKSRFDPACTASSTDDVPSAISDAGEQVLVLIGVREDNKLAEALSVTKVNFPDAHVVVVGDTSNYGSVMTALELGAASFVDENMPTSSLVKELELVAMGEPVISVSVLKQLVEHGSAPVCKDAEPPRAVDHPQSPAPQGRDGPILLPTQKYASPPAADEPEPPPGREEQAAPERQLSKREAAILSLLVQGTPNKSIAYKLQITEATVKVHVKAILRKIRVQNRTQAAIWAMKCQGLRERLHVPDENGVLLTP
jgi:two-component system, NarL family, nitrate/nitrite response regulator NarL